MWKPGDPIEIIDIGPDVDYCIHYLPTVEEFMNKAHPANKPQEAADHMKPSSGNAHGKLHTEKHDIPEHGKKVHNVAEPSMGGQNRAGKDSSNPCDAKGNPGRYSRTAPGHATETSGRVKAALDKQNGSNGMQAN